MIRSYHAMMMPVQEEVSARAVPSRALDESFLMAVKTVGRGRDLSPLCRERKPIAWISASLADCTKFTGVSDRLLAILVTARGRTAR